MLIRIVSDLHIEFWNYDTETILEMVIPPTPQDKDTVLCIAGDLGVYHSYKVTIAPALKILAERFSHVFYVPGNHEWYGSSFWFEEREFWEDKKIPFNVTVCEYDGFIIHEEVVFIQSTLWTDFGDNPMAKFHAERYMSDFDCIRKPIRNGTTGRITPDDIVDKFNKSKQFIFEVLEMFKDRKCVVITHHMPSELCVNERYKGDLLNHAFYSELGNEIAHIGKPDLWIHGHTHSSVDITLGSTNIVCNPYGYRGRELNKQYIPILVKEI